MTFGLNSLLAAVALVSIALCVLFVVPAAVATPLLAAIWVVLGAMLTAGIVYGRGNTRAFCAGAMLPVGGTIFALVWLLFSWILAGPYETDSFEGLFEHFERLAFTLRAWSAGGWPLTLVAGLASVAGRIVFAPRRADEGQRRASQGDSRE